VDGLEPVTRKPVDPAWRQVYVHEKLHDWRSGTSTSSVRQPAYDKASAMSLGFQVGILAENLVARAACGDEADDGSDVT
jgi:hypothetical protein